MRTCRCGAKSTLRRRGWGSDDRVGAVPLSPGADRGAAVVAQLAGEGAITVPHRNTLNLPIKGIPPVKARPARGWGTPVLRHDERQAQRTRRADAFLAEQAENRQGDLERVRAYVALLQPLLGLQHWKLIVDDESPEGKDAAAHISCMETRHVANLSFSDDYFRSTPEQRRHYTTHELVHCLLAQLDYAAGDFEHACDELSWRHLYTTYRRQTELAVDDLAAVIAPFLPLPPGEEG